jgi:hypothetical protein
MNARGKTVDKTFLSLDTAEKRGFIHRDYVAHCFRWTHAAKHIQRKWREAVILDVGCGKEMPLPKLIYSSRMRPLQYVGVDVEDSPMPDVLSKVTFPCEKIVCDVAELDFGDFTPNFVTCFEVLEHVELDHAQRILTHLRAHVSDDCLFMVSTPCYNLKDVADNHVNEMTYNAFGALLEDTGWAIDAHYGTFASQSDYKQQLFNFGEGAKAIYDGLAAYYDSNVLSVIFAPLFPAQSRNCVWDCSPATEGYERKFAPLAEQPRPWGSSEKCL